MRFMHSGRLVPVKVFLDIVYAHLPGLADNWYATDKLLKETVDALETVLKLNVELERMLEKQHAAILELKQNKQDTLKHQEVLNETIKLWKSQAEIYKKIFLMSRSRNDQSVD